MQERIPQSIAKRIVFKAFLAADHVTAAGAALTIPVQISKNGGAFANLATPANATSVGNGWYYVDLAIADTGTLGPLVVRGTEGTIDPVELICEVVAATNAGFTALPAVAAGAASGLPLKDANNFLNVANIPAYAAGATSGLALVGSSMIVPDTQKVDVNTIKTSSPAAANVASVFLGTGDVDDVDLVMRNFHVLSDTDHAAWFKSTAEDSDGLRCEGTANGQYNGGADSGQWNSGGIVGQWNNGGEIGQSNTGETAGDIYLGGTGTFINAAGNVVQIGSAAALAAYNTTGVAKEASVGAVKTVVDAIAAEVTPVTPPAPIVM